MPENGAMNERDALLLAFKEMLTLFALLAGMGTLVAGRYLAEGDCRR